MKGDDPMSRSDFNRPTFRTRGRQTEQVNGGEIPVELMRPPRGPAISKSALRAQAEAAVAAFKARQQPKPAAQARRPDQDEAPPWE